MGRRPILTIMAILSLAVAITPDAFAQPARLKDAIVGSWTLVSLRSTRPDGSVAMPYGPRAAGTAWFDEKGRFGIILINPDIPKFAAAQRPTPAEAMAVATGSDALFGTYSVDGAARTLLLHVAASSYPNDTGTDQTRVVKSIGETDLVLDIPASASGGAAVELVLKRVE
jgi:hypothetical protein